MHAVYAPLHGALMTGSFTTSHHPVIVSWPAQLAVGTISSTWRGCLQRL